MESDNSATWITSSTWFESYISCQPMPHLVWITLYTWLESHYFFLIFLFGSVQIDSNHEPLDHMKNGSISLWDIVSLYLLISFKSWKVIDMNLTSFFHPFLCLISNTYKFIIYIVILGNQQPLIFENPKTLANINYFILNL